MRAVVQRVTSARVLLQEQDGKVAKRIRRKTFVGWRKKLLICEFLLMLREK